MVGIDNSALLNWKSKVLSQNADIIAHEEAHKSGAGPQAVGNPVYNKQTLSFGGQSLEMITGGHQLISLPGAVNEKSSKAQIQASKTAAQYAERGALAPTSALSGADKAIAFAASKLQGIADNALSKKEANEANSFKHTNEAKQRKPLNIVV